MIGFLVLSFSGVLPEGQKAQNTGPILASEVMRKQRNVETAETDG